MNNEELKSIFDQQASGYEKHQEKLSPIRDGLHFLLESVFAGLPKKSRILCVGLGTGAELIHLAKKFPEWSFTAVEPSGKMLDVCRENAEKNGVLSRCQFHEGYLESLPDQKGYDAATCFMVSQFILNNESRAEFFLQIAKRLNSEGILASSDLSADVNSVEFNSLLAAWVNMLFAADVPLEAIERTRSAWAKDVAILPPQTVESIIKSGGFTNPVEFYQMGLVHAWFSKRV